MVYSNVHSPGVSCSLHAGTDAVGFHSSDTAHQSLKSLTNPFLHPNSWNIHPNQNTSAHRITAVSRWGRPRAGELHMFRVNEAFIIDFKVITEFTSIFQGRCYQFSMYLKQTPHQAYALHSSWNFYNVFFVKEKNEGCIFQ